VSEPAPPGTRLDSWKAIAEYLGRDVATVARWEKLGMPVHRIGGTGRSVFAYSSEIDDWIQTATPVVAALDPTRVGAPTPWIRVYPWQWILIAAVAVAVAAAGLVLRAGRTGADDLKVEMTNAGVIARNSAGVEQWRRPFPATSKTGLFRDPVQVVGGTHPGVYVGTSYRSGAAENERIESGTLTMLDLGGRPQRSFSFDDHVTFHGTSYGPPWALTAFAVSDAKGTRRVAVAAHHYIWDPGLVTILDSRWQRRGTFVHDGWIEGVRWLGPERLLIAGFSNTHEGGMIALLDAGAFDGQGPEAPGSRGFCETCGTGRPLRTFVFPRSEINRVSGAPFNRAVVQTFADGHVLARTIEMTTPMQDADALYEFTASLDFVSARFGERYWEMHRALEAEGRITHSREQCPDRDGPRQIQMWEPATGWRTVRTR
jgi:hypothetical protein